MSYWDVVLGNFLYQPLKTATSSCLPEEKDGCFWLDSAININKNLAKTLDSYWDVLMVLRINGLFHPYISRLDTSPK